MSSTIYLAFGPRLPRNSSYGFKPFWVELPSQVPWAHLLSTLQWMLSHKKPATVYEQPLACRRIDKMISR